MKILVIIVTYNAMRWAERCLGSLKNSSIIPDVFVVDNGSTDGTQEYIKNNCPEVMFQQSKENLGFGRANNIGLQYALDNNYDYVYLLNQDAWILPDTLEKLISVSMNNQEYGILSPFQMEANMQHIDRNFKRSTCSWSSSSELLDDLYLKKDREVIPVSRVMAAHWFITRKCLEIVGGFSITFPHYGEDDNYLHRMSYRGLKIGVVPSLKVVHDRENREMTKGKMIYMCYKSGLLQFSNMNISLGRAFVRSTHTSLMSAVKFHSFRPIWDLLRILFHLPAILRNRRVSIQQECAFLRK